MRRFTVRNSPIHGRGAFALTWIAAGEPIIEYKGEVISVKEAQRRFDRSSVESGHTFFFTVDDGHMIDGARGGNSARWINHSCAPNVKPSRRVIESLSARRARSVRVLRSSSTISLTSTGEKPQR
jgi:SET domain-containing protein